MDGQLQPVFIKLIHRSEGCATIDLQQIFCGACTWQGIPADLVESMM